MSVSKFRKKSWSVVPRRVLRSVVVVAALRGTTPWAVTLCSGLAVSGCLFGSPGPSNVAQGDQYTSGDPSYDQFFSQLFLVQLDMGKAPDREQAIRTRLANAAGVAPTAQDDEIVAALETRTAKLSMSGTQVKLAASGLDGNDAATAKVVTTGTPSGPKDVTFIAVIDQSVKDSAALISDMRTAKPTIARLEGKPEELEGGVEEAFHKGGKPKQAEVKKNLHDAQTLIPLMTKRASDVEKRQIELLTKLEKTLGKANAAPPPAPPPVETPPEAPKKKGAKKSPTPGSAAPSPSPSPSPPTTPSPAPAPAPKPKPAAPPAEDFEP